VLCGQGCRTGSNGISNGQVVGENWRNSETNLVQGISSFVNLTSNQSFRNEKPASGRLVNDIHPWMAGPSQLRFLYAPIINVPVGIITPYLTKHHAIEVQLPEFLTSTLGGGEWSVLRPGYFTSRCPLNRRLCGLQCRPECFACVWNSTTMPRLPSPRRHYTVY
jgi:hypothetical protein